MNERERQQQPHTMRRPDTRCFGCGDQIGRRKRLPVGCVALCDRPGCTAAVARMAARAGATNARLDAAAPAGVVVIEDRP